MSLRCSCWPRLRASVWPLPCWCCWHAQPPPAAASLGALLALCYALTPGYPHSPLWGLAATLVLTLGASRIGRARKQLQGTAEPRSGRTAAQVAANLGVGALAGAAINSHGMLLAQAAMLAALGEATADTLASELGQLASAPPRLLLTGRRVLPGTDGAVSLPGTAAGLLGAMLIALVVHWAFALPWPVVSLALAAAVAGLLLDSVFGQLFELRGWLGNDAVNFLSTLSAALLTLTPRADTFLMPHLAESGFQTAAKLLRGA